MIFWSYAQSIASCIPLRLASSPKGGSRAAGTDRRTVPLKLAGEGEEVIDQIPAVKHRANPQVRP